MKWRNSSPGRFYSSNEITVVYFDSHSGDTFLISEFAAYLMQQLGDQSLSTEELANKISPSIDLGDFTDLNEAISGVLEELVALDILQRE